MVIHNGASGHDESRRVLVKPSLTWYTDSVKNILSLPRLLSVALVLSAALPVFAQTEQNSDTLPASFSQMNEDASLGCALFLPGNIPGITEMMSLCGGRYAFRVAPQGMVESQLLMGAGKAQKYYLLSVHYRYDFMASDNNIASFYGGLDLHDAVSPIRDINGSPYDSSSTLYVGVHIGGALWWEITDTFLLRTDLQLNVNPGTALIVFVSAVLRFGSGGGGGP
jgi:hypothetical protein